MRQALAVAVVLFTAAGSRAVDEGAVKQAIDRGVARLRAEQGPDGTWAHAHIGRTALCALTLLECGATADDKAVQAAAKAVRDAAAGSPANPQPLTHTYSLALSIIFLDRLGDPGDVPLIESLTVRLLAGQSAMGGWTYDCPQISAEEVKRLADVAKRQNELVGRRELPKGPARKRTAKDLAPEIQAQLVQLSRAAPQGNASDNSNTQFATLGLWVGRRHGLPVDGALARVDARFRTSQGLDGGWTYMGAPAAGPGVAMVHASRASMTCAGLLGLAVGAGSNGELVKERGKTPRDLSKDANIRGALQALDSVVGTPGNGRRPIGPVGGQAYYFLWSLERCMVALNLETLGKKDWYGWGAEILLANQQRDGSWIGMYPEGDTCFALLFLRRSNLARDLSASLRDRFSRSGTKVLTSRPGIGSGLKEGAEGGLKSPITGEEKPPESQGSGGARPAPGDRKGPPAAPAKPPVKVVEDTPAARLGGDLVRARGARQDQMLQALRDGKGVLFTEALVSAIPRLEGEARRKAREALADRVTRMSDKTLSAYLQDEDPELRRAAALACAMKESKERVPELIRLLSDPEAVVERAAHAALKDLTGQDFGPEAGSGRAERAKAIAAWKVWWDKQSRR
jgi:hypothetical protein